MQQVLAHRKSWPGVSVLERRRFGSTPFRGVLAALAGACVAACGQMLLHTDHPLAGRIWDARAAQFVDEGQMLRRATEAKFVLLGETHDNSVHHGIQERVLEAIVADGRRPALVMEQFDTSQQGEIDRVLRQPDRTPDKVAEAAKLSRGWDWPLYEPLVARALKYDLPIVAGNLSRSDSRHVAARGFASLGDERVEKLGLNAVWSDLRQARMMSALSGGHCGVAPEASLLPLSRSQRAKDAVMAEAIARYADRGAVVILGRGHARGDIGVPIYLDRLTPAVPQLVVGIVEVEPGIEDARRYSTYPGGNEGPLYDFVWFTARAARKDPCADFDPQKLKAAVPSK